MRREKEPQLPPCSCTKTAERLALAVGMVDPSRRVDAVQEAWVAHFAGECPLKAVRRFEARERRYVKRFKRPDPYP